MELIVPSLNENNLISNIMVSNGQNETLDISWIVHTSALFSVILIFGENEKVNEENINRKLNENDFRYVIRPTCRINIPVRVKGHISVLILPGKNIVDQNQNTSNAVYFYKEERVNLISGYLSPKKTKISCSMEEIVSRHGVHRELFSRVSLFSTEDVPENIIEISDGSRKIQLGELIANKTEIMDFPSRKDSLRCISLNEMYEVKYANHKK